MALIKDDPQNEHVCGGKIYLSKSKMTPPEMSAKKNNLLLTLYTYYAKCVRFRLPLPISVTVSIFTVSAFIFLTHTSNIPILLTAIPQRTTITPIHCTGYIAHF